MWNGIGCHVIPQNLNNVYYHKNLSLYLDVWNSEGFQYKTMSSILILIPIPILTWKLVIDSIPITIPLSLKLISILIQESELSHLWYGRDLYLKREIFVCLKTWFTSPLWFWDWSRRIMSIFDIFDRQVIEIIVCRIVSRWAPHDQGPSDN